jgi:hypothetical protein
MGGVDDEQTAKGWQTIGDLRQKHRKDYYVVQRAVQSLQSELVRDLCAIGVSDADANDLVQDHLIGERRNRTGSRKWVLMVSPDAERLLPFAESEGEQPQPNIVRDQIGQRLETLRDQLLQEIQSAGYSQEEAVQLIERHLGKPNPEPGTTSNKR